MRLAGAGADEPRESTRLAAGSRKARPPDGELSASLDRAGARPELQKHGCGAGTVGEAIRSETMTREDVGGKGSRVVDDVGVWAASGMWLLHEGADGSGRTVPPRDARPVRDESAVGPAPVEDLRAVGEVGGVCGVGDIERRVLRGPQPDDDCRGDEEPQHLDAVVRASFGMTSGRPPRLTAYPCRLLSQQIRQQDC